MNDMGFQTIEDRLEDFRQLLERQKESYVDLLQNEILILKNETEASLKSSLSKELLKINSEICGVQESFERFCSQLRGSQETADRRLEESQRGM